MRYYIGIDPDLRQSGYAVWDHQTRSLVEYGKKSLYDLLQMLNFYKTESVVIIEAGWLNRKSNWHIHELGTRAEKVAYRVGQNHAVGMLIHEYCEKVGIPTQLFRPHNKKLDHIQLSKIVNIKKRVNQDVRDAILMVYGL